MISIHHLYTKLQIRLMDKNCHSDTVTYALLRSHLDLFLFHLIGYFVMLKTICYTDGKVNILHMGTCTTVSVSDIVYRFRNKNNSIVIQVDMLQLNMKHVLEKLSCSVLLPTKCLCGKISEVLMYY